MIARAVQRGLAVLVIALAVSYYPAALYADHVDATQIKKLQIEHEDLVVNSWRVELKRRTPEQVTREVDEQRHNAALVMGAIWVAGAALVGALFYVLL